LGPFLASGPRRSRLRYARAQPRVADQLLRGREAGDVAQLRGDGRRRLASLGLEDDVIGGSMTVNGQLVGPANIRSEVLGVADRVIPCVQ
jgi:hypothetical protein